MEGLGPGHDGDDVLEPVMHGAGMAAALLLTVDPGHHGQVIRVLDLVGGHLPRSHHVAGVEVLACKAATSCSRMSRPVTPRSTCIPKVRDPAARLGHGRLDDAVHHTGQRNPPHAPGCPGTGRTHAHVELGGESYSWDGPPVGAPRRHSGRGGAHPGAADLTCRGLYPVSSPSPLTRRRRRRVSSEGSTPRSARAASARSRVRRAAERSPRASATETSAA
jgi:hypothetical protein